MHNFIKIHYIIYYFMNFIPQLILKQKYQGATSKLDALYFIFGKDFFSKKDHGWKFSFSGNLPVINGSSIYLTAKISGAGDKT